MRKSQEKQCSRSDPMNRHLHRRLLSGAISCAVLLAVASAVQSDPTPARRVATQALNAEDLVVEVDRRKPFDLAALPEQVRQLNGKRVQIRGYMLPAFKIKNNEQFMLTTETSGQTYLHNDPDIPLMCLVAVHTLPN